jgi:murein DD-endopeptidase MepM/ murein hydrolase activator NlpD
MSKSGFLVLLLWGFLLPIVGFPANPHPEKSLPASPDSARSFIRSMNTQQLQTLIDYLFEMDSIPADLIKEINASVLEKREIWDEQNVFSWKEVNAGLDTSCLINIVDTQHPCFSMPASGVITCNFGWHKTYFHNGIDIDLRRGTPVAAAFDGIVRFAKWQNGYGFVVVLRHANGLETLYAHLSRINVKTGQLVNSGETVGLGGATGNATGNHLHFEVRLFSKPVNPKYLIEFGEKKLIQDSFIFNYSRRNRKWLVGPA